jgi:opacity protein-like surface antigen
MKRSFSVFFSSALFGVVLAAFSAQAQVVPSATARQFSITAGALGSAFQPDYTANYGVGSNPDYLFGVGAYVDLRFTRWIQIEGEGRWSRFNPNLGFNESNYLGGFRVPVRRFGRFTPYGKVLYGLGTASFLTGSGLASNLTLGGGVDYRLTRKISIRAADFEYQRWRTKPTLAPYGFSVGIGYKVF